MTASLEGSGGDLIYGGSGSDKISGGAGSDLISGDSGDDNLAGNEGLDTYHFDDAWGDDRFTDLKGEVILDFTDLTTTLESVLGQNSTEFKTTSGSLNVGRAVVSQVLDNSGDAGAHTVTEVRRVGDVATIDLAEILGPQYSSFGLVESQKGDASVILSEQFLKTGLLYIVPEVRSPTLSSSGRLVNGAPQSFVEITATANYKVNDKVAFQVNVPIKIRFADSFSGLDNDIDRVVEDLTDRVNRMRVQQRLKFLGYRGLNGLPLVIDGDFGSSNSNTRWAIGHFNAVVEGSGTVIPSSTFSNLARKWINASNAPRWVALPDQIGEAVNIQNSAGAAKWSTHWALEALFNVGRNNDAGSVLDVRPLSNEQGSSGDIKGMTMMFKKPENQASFVAQVAAFQNVKGVAKVLVVQDIRTELMELIEGELSFLLEVSPADNATVFKAEIAIPEPEYNPILTLVEQRALLSLLEQIDDTGERLGVSTGFDG